MAMTSVCTGCACEEACGHADMSACAYRRPARWCSCDMLRRAEAERSWYRERALGEVCCNMVEHGKCNQSCGGEGHCTAVKEAVDFDA